MKLHRIYAIVLRYLYLFRHSYDRISDVFYWPTIDLLLFGLTAFYVETYAEGVLAMVVSGIVLWLTVWRGQYEISVNILEELWNKNLINIFVSPIKFREWVAAFLVIGLIQCSLAFVFATGMSYLLYKVSIFSIGNYLPIFLVLLIMTGWWAGFIIAGIVLRYGTKVQMLAWTLVMVLSPFSGIYYPISVLPDWAEKIAMLIPSSYIFEASRALKTEGKIDPNFLLISFGLNIVYLGLSFVYFKRSFNKALDRGLVKLY